MIGHVWVISFKRQQNIYLYSDLATRKIENEHRK